MDEIVFSDEKGATFASFNAFFLDENVFYAEKVTISLGKLRQMPFFFKGESAFFLMNIPFFWTRNSAFLGSSKCFFYGWKFAVCFGNRRLTTRRSKVPFPGCKCFFLAEEVFFNYKNKKRSKILFLNEECPFCPCLYENDSSEEKVHFLTLYNALSSMRMPFLAGKKPFLKQKKQHVCDENC